MGTGVVGTVVVDMVVVVVGSGVVEDETADDSVVEMLTDSVVVVGGVDGDAVSRLWVVVASVTVLVGLLSIGADVETVSEEVVVSTRL